jgi:FixJ family two-component response regulator
MDGRWMSETKGIVFLVDDNAGVLMAISNLLRAAGYEIRTFTSPRKFLEEHEAAVTGCAILDLSMPEMNGLEVQSELSSRQIERPIIFLSGEGDIRQTVTAMKGGAVDFLTKPVQQDELLSVVAKAIEQDSNAKRVQKELSALQERIGQLTERQREVMLQVVAGRLNKQIAGDLGTVEKTIKMHRARMMAKLGVRTVAELVRLTERAGLKGTIKKQPSD